VSYPPILSAGYVGAVSLQVVDFPDDIELDSSAVDAAGNASVMTDPVALGYIWRVERLTTFVTTAAGALVTPPAGAVMNVYKVPAGVSTGLPKWFRDGSQSPGLDVADESSPITVQQGLSLLFAWSGHAPGTFCHATAQYALYRRFVGGS
jgi:hypothetical protein